jgi:uncharacterized repeat protein (TIGR03943 family)
VRRDAQAAVLLLVGATLVKISVTGAYVRYVKPGLLPLLLAAGVVLMTVAVVTLWRAVRAPAPGPHPANADDEYDAEADADHDGGHEHDHGRSRVGWLLVVPTLALLLFAPPALGAYQADRNGTALSRGADSDYATLPAGDPVRLPLLEYAARAVFDQGRSLAGRRVALTGFVLAGPDGRPYLTRLVVGCCAADARPVKIGLTGDVPSDLVPDQWLEVEGVYSERMVRDPVNGEAIPFVSVVTSREIAAPAEPYET